MQIKKVGKKVELNVSAQGCKDDCTYWKTWSSRAYKSLGSLSGCAKTTDARWCRWW